MNIAASQESGLVKRFGVHIRSLMFGTDVFDHHPMHRNLFANVMHFPHIMFIAS